MAYRDDREALLARLQALTTDLAAAKEEIRALERRSNGTSEPFSNEAAEIATNLKSARSRLAGLIGGKKYNQESSSPAIEKSRNAARDNDVACAALAHGLRAILVAKIGHVPELLEVALESLPPLMHLINALVFAAEHQERLELTSGVAKALAVGRLV